MTPRPCPACNGARLQAGGAGRHRRRPQHRSRSTALPVGEALRWAKAPEERRRRSGTTTTVRLPRRPPSPVLRHRRASALIAHQVLKEIRARLAFLVDVGLGYLTLDRGAATLSRRRGAAHPAGDADRRGADGRALYPRRAEHRPAPARQRPADGDPAAAARHRQHGAGRRARRGHDSRRRLDRGHRAGRRRAWRRADRQRPDRADYRDCRARSPASIFSGERRIPVPKRAAQRQRQALW